MNTAALPHPEPAVLRETLRCMLAEKRAALLSFVRKRVQTQADAEDILQSASLRATEKVETLRDETLLVAWFYRILRNAIADHLAAGAEQGDRLKALAREAADLPPPEAASCACSLGVLTTLRPEYEDILRRIDIEDATLGETASALHIGPSNAKVRLHRARKAMREALLAYCGTDSVKACLSCNCE